MTEDVKVPMRAQTANKLFFGASMLDLGVAIGMVGFRSAGGFSAASAVAQTMRPSTTGGIMAFTGQIDKNTYGIMMIDVDAGTLWVYQYREKGNQLKLLASRSWLYDRYLEEYNNAPPTPSEVAQLIAVQQQKGSSSTTTGPAGPEGVQDDSETTN